MCEALALKSLGRRIFFDFREPQRSARFGT